MLSIAIIAAFAAPTAPASPQSIFRSPAVELAPLMASAGGFPSGGLVAQGRHIAIHYLPAFTTDRARVSVFDYVAGSWVENFEIDWPAVSDVGDFGRSLELADETLLIGAPNTGGRGEVHIIERRLNGSPHWQASLLQVPSSVDIGFGRLLKLDGATLVATAARFVDEAFPNSGVVYVFRRASSGWHLEDSLVAPPADQVHANLRFGDRVDVSGDVLAVGASTQAVVNGVVAVRTGSVFVYERAAAGAWLPTQRIDCPDPEEDSDFGRELALNGDTLVVGRPGSIFSSRPGSIFIYERDASGQFVLAQQSAPTTGFVDVNGSDQFGSSIEIEGDLVAAGSRRSVNSEGDKNGAIFLFHRNTDGTWPSQETAALGVPSAHGAGFGLSFSLDEGRVFASIAQPSGPAHAAYIFGATTTADLCAPTPMGGGVGLRIDFSAKSEVSADSDILYVSNALDSDVILLMASLQGDPSSGVVIGGVGRTCLAGPAFLALPRRALNATAGTLVMEQDFFPTIRRMVRTQGSFVLQGAYRRSAPGSATMLTNAVSVEY
ncbi:MAG: hypothetical protein AAF690_25110 [Acidobacteriota bacterium]